jgi:peptidoglycan-N-acetylglucosamine deacetylase
VRRAAPLLLSLFLVAGVSSAKPHKKKKHHVVHHSVTGKNTLPHPVPSPSPSPAPVQQLPPEVLFTFDDGPALERTPRLLDVLDQHKVKAVFFVLGQNFSGPSARAEKARALLRDMVKRGHNVGNHTVHHYFLCGKRGPLIAYDEFEQNSKLIQQAIGERPELFRTPYGAHCKSLSETTARLGIKPIAWDIDPQDWKLRNTEKVRDYVINQLKHLRGRNILLLHDIHEETVNAVPQILDWLDKENAARVKRGEVPIKIGDYSWLLPPHPAFPPLLEGLARVLINGVPVATHGVLWLWRVARPAS